MVGTQLRKMCHAPNVEVLPCSVQITQAPMYVCAGETPQLSATFNVPGGTVGWAVTQGSGSINSAGQLTIPTTSSEGPIYVRAYLTNRQSCSDTREIRIIDSQPGEDGEWWVAIVHPGAAIVANQLADVALDWAIANELALGGDLNGGCADAARHAYWNCLMAADPDIGPEIAEDFATGHEHSGANSCDDNVMDMSNNEVGRGLASNFTGDPNSQSQIRTHCRSAVVNALHDGMLRVLVGNPSTLTNSGGCNPTLIPGPGYY